MELVEFITKDEYKMFLAKHEEVNFLQSWQWGQVHDSLGDVVIRSGVRHEGKLVAVWTAIVKDAKRGRYLEVPGGPIMNWGDSDLLKLVMKQLTEIARQKKCVFVRFRPQVKASTDIEKALSDIGVRKSPMHLHAEHTSLLDIKPSTDDLLSKMRRQTRYEVRRVEKRSLSITSRTPTMQDIDEFYDLQLLTAKRHGFIQSSRHFLQTLREELGDNLKIYQAKTLDDQLLNVALVIQCGEEADYYEAASSMDARKEPGAYGVVWQAIKESKLAGCTRFNFWGIAYSDNPKHRYAGVTTFKRGFGGEDHVFVPAHDIVAQRGRYMINWIIETIRRKRRGL